MISTPALIVTVERAKLVGGWWLTIVMNGIFADYFCAEAPDGFEAAAGTAVQLFRNGRELWVAGRRWAMLEPKDKTLRLCGAQKKTESHLRT